MTNWFAAPTLRHRSDEPSKHRRSSFGNAIESNVLGFSSKRFLVLIPILMAFGATASPAQPANGSSQADSAIRAEDSAAPVAVDASSMTQASPALLPTSSQPRSMRAYWHVFIAFGLTWLLLLGYIVSLGRRFSQLEREVRGLLGPTGRLK